MHAPWRATSMSLACTNPSPFTERQTRVAELSIMGPYRLIKRPAACSWHCDDAWMQLINSASDTSSSTQRQLPLNIIKALHSSTRQVHGGRALIIRLDNPSAAVASVVSVDPSAMPEQDRPIR